MTQKTTKCCFGSLGQYDLCKCMRTRTHTHKKTWRNTTFVPNMGCVQAHITACLVPLPFLTSFCAVSHKLLGTCSLIIMPFFWFTSLVNSNLYMLTEVLVWATMHLRPWQRSKGYNCIANWPQWLPHLTPLTRRNCCPSRERKQPLCYESTLYWPVTNSFLRNTLPMLKVSNPKIVFQELPRSVIKE